MGQILSQPSIRKDKEEELGLFSSYGVCSMQGWRTSMEDEHITLTSLLSALKSADIEEETKKFVDGLSKENKFLLEKLSFFTVFDGHGGDFVARFSGSNVGRILAVVVSEKYNEFLKEDRDVKDFPLSECLIEAFLKTDEELLEDKLSKLDHSGCTATSLLLDSLNKVLYCANAGDSRTVLATNGFAKNLSFDHKPTNIGEKTRIMQAGGFVESSRVNGNLALSRAIGDFEFKRNDKLPAEEQIVTAYPDIIAHDLNLDFDDFVILACDGIWDCLSSQECVNLVYYAIQQFPKDKEFSLAELSSIIIDVCCSPDAGGHGIGCDNMTMMVVALLKEGETLQLWKNRVLSKNIKLDEDANFVDYRKKIFNYYQFEDEQEFSVTRKSGKITFDNSGEEESEEKDIDMDADEAPGSRFRSGLHKQAGQSNKNRPGNEKTIQVPLSEILQLGGDGLTYDQNGMSYIKGDFLKVLGLAGANARFAQEDEDDEDMEEHNGDVKIEEVEEDEEKEKES
ncbi:hypothetical protein QEN19_003480 [Hanseniaspora menglaensis]